MPDNANQKYLHLTLISAGDPVDKIEIVRVNHMTSENGEWRLDVTRSMEDTVAYSFDVGDIIYLAHTKAAIDNKPDRSEVIEVYPVRTNEQGIPDPNGDYETLFGKRTDGSEILLMYSYPKYA